MKVFLSGEGPTELGDWAKELPYRASTPEVGVIEALLRKAWTHPYTVVDACLWKRIRKFRSQDHLRPETRNVLGLALQADEAGCDALAFVRDQDGDEERQADIEEGVRFAQAKGLDVDIVGGVAVQEIEAWILAILGERRSEHHSDAKQVLKQRHQITEREEMVEVIEARGIDGIPEDAASLRAWLEMATRALGEGD